MLADGEDPNISLAAGGIDYGQPLLIRRHCNVSGRAGEGYGFVKHSALVVAEELGDGGAGRVARVPDAQWPLGYPAGRIDGKGWRWSRDRIKVAALVHDREAVRTVCGSEAQDVSPERSPKGNHIRVAGQRDRSAGTVEHPIF